MCVPGEAVPSSVSATLEDDDTWTATIRTSSDVYIIEVIPVPRGNPCPSR